MYFVNLIIRARGVCERGINRLEVLRRISVRDPKSLKWLWSTFREKRVHFFPYFILHFFRFLPSIDRDPIHAFHSCSTSFFRITSLVPELSIISLPSLSWEYSGDDGLLLLTTGIIWCRIIWLVTGNTNGLQLTLLPDLITCASKHWTSVLSNHMVPLDLFSAFLRGMTASSECLKPLWTSITIQRNFCSVISWP